MNLVDIFFPRRCVGCQKIGSYLCEKCFQTIEFIDFQICPECGKAAVDGATHPKCQRALGMDGMYAAARFDGAIKSGVHQLKYRLVTDMGNTLASIILESLPKKIPTFDLIIPVPLHIRRKNMRGFNQAEVLARFLSSQLSIPMAATFLERIRYTTPQAELKRGKRLVNLQGAFALKKGSEVKGKRIAIIDDVATTRATLLECATVLKKAGAKVVWGIVLAHG